MTAWIFFALSLFGAWLTWNVFRPTYAPGRMAIVSFFAGWLVAELALHQVVIWTIASIGFIAAGALEKTIGQLALILTIASCAALLYEYFRGGSAGEAVERGLVEAFGADYRSRILAPVAARMRNEVDWRSIALPFPIRHPNVERIRDIPFHRARGITLKLDVYRNRSRPTSCPVLLEIHGGGWVLGTKNEQGLPLMLRLAAQGWVCVTPNYRLSPHATFPEHLVDVKKAIQWIREHGAEYGADPQFIVVAGQSAGGHLASLVALTPNEPDLQPGFEHVDTSVRGCVSFYGVYDFTNRYGLWAQQEMARLLEEQVLKASLEEDRHLWERASPIGQLSPDDPPFFVIHGDRDTLVPVKEARQFCDEFRKIVRAPIAYAEIAGAQHAFEIFPSLRGELVLAAVERFVGILYSDFLRAQDRTDSVQLAAVGRA